MHVYDVLTFSKKKHCIDIIIISLSEGDGNFELNDGGSVDKCLVIEISNHRYGSHELKQPYLTKRIIDELNLSAVETQKRPTPVASPFLHKYLIGKERVKQWNYRSVIGMMTYLQGIPRPDIMMDVH